MEAAYGRVVLAPGVYDDLKKKKKAQATNDLRATPDCVWLQKDQEGWGETQAGPPETTLQTSDSKGAEPDSRECESASLIGWFATNVNEILGHLSCLMCK